MSCEIIRIGGRYEEDMTTPIKTRTSNAYASATSYTSRAARNLRDERPRPPRERVYGQSSILRRGDIPRRPDRQEDGCGGRWFPSAHHEHAHGALREGLYPPDRVKLVIGKGGMGPDTSKPAGSIRPSTRYFRRLRRQRRRVRARDARRGVGGLRHARGILDHARQRVRPLIVSSIRRQ